MLVNNLEIVPGRRVVKHLGLVQGSTVRAKHIGKDLLASLKNIVAGELTSYTDFVARGAWRRHLVPAHG